MDGSCPRQKSPSDCESKLSQAEVVRLTYGGKLSQAEAVELWTESELTQNIKKIF